MLDAYLMTLVNWLEGAACKCFYSFEGLYIKPRYMTPERKERREEYLQDALALVALCKALYKMQLQYKTT